MKYIMIALAMMLSGCGEYPSNSEVFDQFVEKCDTPKTYTLNMSIWGRSISVACTEHIDSAGGGE